MSKSVLQGVAAAIGGALLAGFGPALWNSIFVAKPPIEYKVLVFSTADKTPPVARASVELKIAETPVMAHDTDPNGVATFVVAQAYANKAAELHIKRDGFRELRRPVVVPRGSAPDSVFLEVVPPPVQSLHPPPLTRIFSSGPKASGLGDAWSPSYELCSEPTASYVVASSDLVLKGDRSCGAWSECQKGRVTPEIVCYTFRLQGHSEWFPPRPAFTEGILSVQLVKGP